MLLRRNKVDNGSKCLSTDSDIQDTCGDVCYEWVKIVQNNNHLLKCTSVARAEQQNNTGFVVV